MTVKELIEALEDYEDLPVVVEGCEITEILTRNEIYLSADNEYKDGPVIKVY